MTTAEAVEKLSKIVVYSREPLTRELFDEMVPLLKAHDQETPSATGLALDADFEWFIRMEQAWMLNLYTARKNRELVGYIVGTAMIDPHHKGVKMAGISVAYVKPGHRGFGKEFMVWAEAELAALGAVGIFWSVGATSGLGVILERMNYTVADTIYFGRLN
jgi:hypothetical protein